MAVQVGEVIPFDQNTRGILGEGEQRVWHMPEYTILSQPRGGEARWKYPSLRKHGLEVFTQKTSNKNGLPSNWRMH